MGTENGSSPDAITADVWRQKAVHTVTGHTGAVAKIRIPGIGAILAAGDFPHHLIGVALLDLSHPRGVAGALREMLDEITDDDKRQQALEEVKKLREYECHLVAAALVEPALTVEEVMSGEFPEDDLSMIAEIIQRVRMFDARGVRIGVEPLDRFARFHQEHGLDPEDCEHCRVLERELSSVHVGAV